MTAIFLSLNVLMAWCLTWQHQAIIWSYVFLTKITECIEKNIASWKPGCFVAIQYKNGVDVHGEICLLGKGIMVGLQMQLLFHY